MGVQKYATHFTKALGEDPNDGQANLALGLCYLQLNSHELAEKQFRKVIEMSPFTSEAYFYCALAMIRGRNVRTLSLSEVQRIEELLGTARGFDPSKAHYDYLLAILKGDYYRANGLMVNAPTDIELIEEARTKQQDDNEVYRLFELVPVSDEGIISAVFY
jgi:tetratricopeptide (TPR) repeat protein